jgi:alpha-ketoglutarate-dependent taurine dioxygenase
MIIEPLAGALGAEIRGVALATLQDEAAWQAIHRAFLRYSVLVFRDQALEPAELMRVGAHFGEPCFYPFVTGLDGFPYIFEVVKEEHETTNFGGNWHSDTTYLVRGALRGHEEPSRRAGRRQ